MFGDGGEKTFQAERTVGIKHGYMKRWPVYLWKNEFSCLDSTYHRDYPEKWSKVR